MAMFSMFLMRLVYLHPKHTDIFIYTVDAAKEDPYCPDLTLICGVTLVFRHTISNENISILQKNEFYACFIHANFVREPFDFKL